MLPPSSTSTSDASSTRKPTLTRLRISTCRWLSTRYESMTCSLSRSSIRLRQRRQSRSRVVSTCTRCSWRMVSMARPATSICTCLMLTWPQFAPQSKDIPMQSTLCKKREKLRRIHPQVWFSLTKSSSIRSSMRCQHNSDTGWCRIASWRSQLNLRSDSLRLVPSCWIWQ